MRRWRQAYGIAIHSCYWRRSRGVLGDWVDMGLTSALNWGFMLIWFGLVGMARLPSAKCLANRKLQAISSRQPACKARLDELELDHWMVKFPRREWGAPCQGGGHLTIHFNAACVVCCSLYSKPPFDMEFDWEIKSVYDVIGSLQSQFVLGFTLLVFV